MHTLVTSSRTPASIVAAKVIPLFAAGVAGMVAGGTVWGLLGVACVLFAVWLINDAFETVQHTREIERLYAMSPNLLPTPVPVSTHGMVAERPRAFIRPAVKELESVRG